MENKNLTAVEWLVGQLPIDVKMELGFELIVQAKQMEKEQMLNVFQESRLTHPMIGFKHQTFLEYYNETYGGKGSPDTSPNTQNK